jgi:2-polyprenyl-3-methyl-5-hydroxy-6-metoxy-1,4-benzoquinol methylase
VTAETTRSWAEAGRGDGGSAQARAFAVRIFMASLASAELMAAYLGLRLGLYADLARLGSATPAALAACAGLDPRYVREWLEQQAAAGFLEVEDPGASADERRYRLPPGHAEVLAGLGGPCDMTALALLPAGGMAPVLPRLIRALRNRTGLSYADYGADFRDAQALLNRSVFFDELPGWIERLLPDVHARLRAHGARIADIACGAGWSSIALARAYPNVSVDGFDLDPDSVATARQNAATQGMSGRVRFAADDAAGLAGAGYDLVCVFDALHDMSQPGEVLLRCKELCGPAAAVLLMEPKAAPSFRAPGDETERFLYAISVLHCLPVGLHTQPSAATGTVLRPSTVRKYAAAAGFRDIRVLQAEHRFHRLYRLDP